MRRRGRQDRLPESDEAGRALLASSRVDVAADGFAGEVAARYLAGAGVGHLRVRSQAAADAARAMDGSVDVQVSASIERLDIGDAGVRDSVAREVFVGARFALRAVRSVLGVSK